MSNFPNFPLYNNLKKNEKKILNDDEKDEIINEIKQLKENEYEIVYALIRAYYLENDGGMKMETFPYSGKSLKAGLKMELDNIPQELQNILLNFVRLDKN